MISSVSLLHVSLGVFKKVDSDTLVIKVSMIDNAAERNVGGLGG
ncbi:MAG: hypothetical protein H6Q75_1584 [Firmicutes bacterium]|nr:hypothetical protein [Bacillota bacterium]